MADDSFSTKKWGAAGLAFGTGWTGWFISQKKLR
jgi:hypothetical protein